MAVFSSKRQILPNGRLPDLKKKHLRKYQGVVHIVHLTDTLFTFLLDLVLLANEDS